MAESRGTARTLAQGSLLLGALLFLLGVVALSAGPARALAGAPSSTVPLPVPGAFRLPASDGYTLYVIARPPRGGKSGALLIIASAKGEGVTYEAPATVTETSMQADLGDLGEISVDFHRSNQVASVPCGKRAIRFDSGDYEGKIVFHGEEGYTSAEATIAPGNIDYLLEGICGKVTIEGSGGPRKGAALSVRDPALGPEMSVSKSRPGAAALITARLSEYSNGISIERVTSSWMSGGDFTYDRRLRTATVRPPAPFAGSARFDLDAKAGQRWSGDLTVDMPGQADVPLTGPLLRATLAPSE
jgi:hypothetical protein